MNTMSAPFAHVIGIPPGTVLLIHAYLHRRRQFIGELLITATLAARNYRAAVTTVAYLCCLIIEGCDAAHVCQLVNTQ